LGYGHRHGGAGGGKAELKWGRHEPIQNKGADYEAWCKDTSPTTPCPATPTRWRVSALR